MTGEAVGSNTQYQLEQQKNEISIYNRIDIASKTTKSFYMVNNKWFKNNITDKFAKSIIINNSCESIKTDLLWNTFKQKGVGTYFGYSEIVTNEYVVMQSVELLSEIIMNGKTTAQAYKPTLDLHYNDGGIFQIKGQANLKLPNGLTNGSFESDLIGWQKDGDGRVITQLGFIKPTDGNKMGIISTGMGYTLKHGALKQNIFIPENANTLKFDWNFLSEEFLEYIGSQYDDPFIVTLTLTDENGQEVKILDLSVNKIAFMFNATKNDCGNLISISPDIFLDQGDVWMTDWQSTEFDITPYKGQNIILKFSAEDAVDTAYTTAVLIDNIKFDVENQNIGQKIEVDPLKFSEEFIRGIFAKNIKGSSYILYDPTNYILYDPTNFEKQAKHARKSVKFSNGYKSIEQVKFFGINTEDKFEKTWNGMEGHADTDVIDDVKLLFHSNYYAIIIDSTDDNVEYLTTSPDGKVASGDAYHIRDLNRKKITKLELLTCNNGLIDAIDTKKSISCKDGTLFKTKGNIAQAFLESQDVGVVLAWDGSLSYVLETLSTPRNAFTQTYFYQYIESLSDIRKHKPIRETYLCVEPFGYRDKPIGRVKYYKEKDKMKCSYPIRLNIGVGSIYLNNVIDLGGYDG